MTAPRWIAEAYDSARDKHVTERGDSFTADQLATELIERLPIEAMTEAGFKVLAGGNVSTPEGAVLAMACAMTAVLADGDPEVVQLAELYQGASKALDDAGVPYVAAYADDGDQQAMPLNLAGRIRWLAQQRPIRAELESAQATRKLAEDMATKYMAERDSKASQLEELSKMFTTLSEERDRLAADVEAAAGELLISLDDMPASSDLRRVVIANKLIRDERDRHWSALVDVRSDRDDAVKLAADRSDQLDAAERALSAARQQSAKQAKRIGDLSARKVTKPRGKLPAKLRPRGKKAVRR